jgi:hypothetical protein
MSDDDIEFDESTERMAPVFHMPKKLDVDDLPQKLKRAKSAHGLLSQWRKLRDAVWVNRGIPYRKLPEFAYLWGKRLYETSDRAAYDALCDGDVLFFEAWAQRMLMIDKAAEAAGLTIKDRGTILYVVGIMQGYAEAASARLQRLGGGALG